MFAEISIQSQRDENVRKKECERPETKAADWLLQSHKPAQRSVSSRRLHMINLRSAFLGVEQKVRPLATESAAN